MQVTRFFFYLPTWQSPASCPINENTQVIVNFEEWTAQVWLSLKPPFQASFQIKILIWNLKVLNTSSNEAISSEFSSDFSSDFIQANRRIAAQNEHFIESRLARSVYRWTESSKKSFRFEHHDVVEPYRALERANCADNFFWRLTKLFV